MIAMPQQRPPETPSESASPAPLEDGFSDGPQLLEGRLVDRAGDWYVIEQGERRRLATLAASCLMQPALGDLVSAHLSTDGQARILGVLERADPTAPLVLSVAGDLALVSTGGSVSLRAHEQLDLTGDRRLAIGSEALALRAGSALAEIGEATLLSREATMRSDRLRLVADHLQMVVRQAAGSFKTVFRWVHGTEKVTADHLVSEGRSSATLRGRHTAVLAEQDTRIDGARVHVG